MDEEKLSNTKNEISVSDKASFLVRYWELMIGFILISWPPFFGFVYFNAFLTGIGFDGYHIDLSIQESIFYFLKGTVGVWGLNLIFNEFNLIVSLFISIFVFIITISGWKWKHDIKIGLISLRRFLAGGYSYEVVGWPTSFKFSLLKTVLSFIIIMCVPIILWGALALAFMMAIIAYPLGKNDGLDLLQSEKCIYPKPGDECAKFKVDGSFSSGYLVYGTDKKNFIINENGRYVVDVKGNVLFYRPFENSIYENSSNKKFDSSLWTKDISARPNMLFDLKSNYLEKINLIEFHKSFGLSDSRGSYLHPEFPVFKLSDEKDCVAVFPFEWKNKTIMDIRLFGNCSGVIK